MWKLKHISATNFISFKQLDLEIEQGVCTLLFGENLDNENQKNNGSGKSTIVEAIAFSITGESIKKASSINDIINDYEEEASVSATFVNTDTGITFIIDRHISRQEAQQVICRKIDSEGNDIERERTIQPSINDYNKYILEELGVTKEQLYSCYLLNNARFKSFFTATDKEKKEIINNFSNGILVDEALELLADDITPVEKELSEVRLNVAKAESGLNAIDEQITNAKNNEKEAQQDKEQKIESLKTKIAEKRAAIRAYETEINNTITHAEDLENAQKKLKEIEESEQDVNKCNSQIDKLFDKVHIPAIENVFYKIEAYRRKENNIQESIKDANKQYELLNKVAITLKQVYDKSSEVYEQSKKDVESKVSFAEKNKEAFVQTIKNLKAQMDDCLDKARHNRNKINDLGIKISKLNAQVAGAITCPKCKHQFLLDSTASIDELKNNLSDIEAKKKNLEKTQEEYKQAYNRDQEEYDKKQDELKDYSAEIYNIRQSLDHALQQLLDSKKKYSEANGKVTDLEVSLERLNQQHKDIQDSIANIKAELFKTADEHVAKYIKMCDDFIDDRDIKINSLEEVIKTYLQSIKDFENSQSGDIIANLILSRKKYAQALAEAKEAEIDVTDRYNSLIDQQDYFIRFKSYLANTKIDAIASEVNDFLEKIGSDLRIELSGYKVLKSKKIREKITMNVLRDGAEIGDIAKLSGGERNRVMLAGILAMQHLTNINCEDGKGLELLVVDEVLEASDYSGLMSYTDALNSLGVTTILVTQNGVSEQYTHQLLVRKEGGISTII